MTSLGTLFLFALSLLAFWPFGDALTIKSFEIDDLEENSNDFASEISNWQVSTTNPYGQAYTSCGGTYILGGFEVTWTSSVEFKRTYNSLPSHNTIFLSIDFWLIGSWDVFDTITIKVLTGATATFNQIIYPVIPTTTWTPRACGDTTLSSLMPITVFAQVPHSGNTLTLDITCFSQYLPNQGLAYCGLRNTKILFSSQTANAAITAIKNSGLTNVLSSISTGCLVGQYKDSGTGLCTACDGTCQNCFNQLSTGCLSCKTGLFYDGSICTSCHADCLTCSGSSSNQCLSCAIGKSLNENGTCSTTCNSPYVVTTKNGIQYCEPPCATGYYIYPDGSCSSTCPLPLVHQESYGEIYCENPCQDPSPYYYPSEGLCASTCSDPYSISQNTYYLSCYLPNKREAIDYTIAVTGGIASTGLMILSVISRGDPAAILIGSLAMMGHYVKYFNITYSEYFEKRLSHESSSSIGIDFWLQRANMSTDEFESSQVPYPFKKHQLQPSFIENFLPTFLVFIAITVIFLAIRLYEWTSKKANKNHVALSVIKKARIRAQNFVLILLYLIFPIVVFLAIVDFKSPRDRTNVDSISVAIFFFLILIGLRVFWVHIQLVRLMNKMLDDDLIGTPDDLEEFYRKNSTMQALLREIKASPYVPSLFLLIFMIRVVIFALVTALFDQYPLLQTVIVTMMNFSMLVYLICYWPLNNGVQLTLQIIFEFILFLINISVLVMADLDYKNKTATSARDGLGKFIISMTIIFNLLAILYVVLKGISIVRKTFRDQKAQKVRNMSLQLGTSIDYSQTGKLTNLAFGETLKELKIIDKSHSLNVQAAAGQISFRALSRTKTERLGPKTNSRPISANDNSIDNSVSIIEESKTENSFMIKEKNLFENDNESQLERENDSQLKHDIADKDMNKIKNNDSAASVASGSVLTTTMKQNPVQSLMLSKFLRGRPNNPEVRPVRIGDDFSNLMRLESHHQQHFVKLEEGDKAKKASKYEEYHFEKINE